MLGIILECREDEEVFTKSIDLLTLTKEYLYIFPLVLISCSSDIDIILQQIVQQEPLITASKQAAVRGLLASMCYRFLSLIVFVELVEKMSVEHFRPFQNTQVLRAHALPLTNCAFNKSGDR